MMKEWTEAGRDFLESYAKSHTLQQLVADVIDADCESCALRLAERLDKNEFDPLVIFLVLPLRQPMLQKMYEAHIAKLVAEQQQQKRDDYFCAQFFARTDAVYALPREQLRCMRCGYLWKQHGSPELILPIPPENEEWFDLYCQCLDRVLMLADGMIGRGFLSEDENDG